MASFDQEIHNGQNSQVQLSKVEYYERIQGIFEIDYRTFQIYILDVHWFKVVTKGQNQIVERDAFGFVAIDLTKLWTNQSDTFVLAESCEQVYKYSINSNIN